MRIVSSLFVLALMVSTSALAKDIPVKKVVLSTGGLAHFEHVASVDGNEILQMPVRFNQVDDVLKSLVVFDKEGHIGSVTLPGRQPLAQIFRDLPFSKADMNSPILLLNAYQGADITVTGSETIQGKLIRIVPKKVKVSKRSDSKIPEFKPEHYISMLTEKGLQQFVFEDLKSVQFKDQKIRDEMKRALMAVRENSTQDVRVLSVDMKGQGKRNVTLAYVVEAPLWKSSYRLVMPENKKDMDTGFIQGWAVVENMTSGDWTDVDLTLISGNPVTFRQALYQSYHVQRPELPVEVFGRVMPRVDTGSMSIGRSAASDAPARSKRAQAYGGLMKSNMMMDAESDEIAMPMAAAAPMELREESLGAGAMAQMANAAQSSEATSQVLFTFKDKFNLKAGQSMMVPFVSQKIPVERFSLYQPDTHAEHPLSAVRLKNDGNSGLPPGILTLYEESKTLNGMGFVGDAQLPVLGKGEERLISYALDSKTNISRKSKNNQRRDTITIAKGVMRTAVKYRSETEYTIKAPAEESRVVMIEHLKQYNYDLITPSPKDTEETKTHYRVKADVKAGAVKKVKIILERDDWESVMIANLSSNNLKTYASTRGKLDQKTRKLFAKMAKMRSAVETVQQQIRKSERNRQEIYKDQNRLRENIRSLGGKSDLKDRYLDRLDDQEDALEAIEENLNKLQSQKLRKQTELEKFVLNIEF